MALTGNQSRICTQIKHAKHHLPQAAPYRPWTILALLLKYIQVFPGDWELSQYWCLKRYPTREDTQLLKESLNSRSNEEFIIFKNYCLLTLITVITISVSLCTLMHTHSCTWSASFIACLLPYAYIISSQRQGISHGLFPRWTMNSLFHY